MRPTILAIESSCDETSAAVIGNGKVLNNIIASQKVHQKYGGVVPELASREHMRQIIPVVDEALRTAGVTAGQLDAVACTRGPGLMGALLVGSSFAKGLAWSNHIPLIEVNHMQAHVLAHFIEEPSPKFPFLCLTVSGGHTELVVVHGPLHMEVIGRTQDDAAGEAFDKASKILGLPYPGGPWIDKHAANGNQDRFTFPGANMPGLDFSFSGIKTAFLYFIRDSVKNNPDFVAENLADICAGLQRSIVRMLMQRLEQAAAETGIRQVAIAGGVSANSALRKELQAAGKRLGWETFVPAFQYCTDNAAMIAMAAHFKFLAGDFAGLDFAPVPNLQLAGV